MSGAKKEVFLSKIAKQDSGCWLWTGWNRPSSSNGKLVYGIFYDKKNVQAHRYSYELFVGPISNGLVIDHLCKNTLCVNPKHLEPVTNKENILRGVSFSAKNSRKTHCDYGHPLFGENLKMRGNWRLCRTCCARHSKESRIRWLKKKRK